MKQFTNHSNLGKKAAGFGAAAASIYVSPELSAAIWGITLSPNSISYKTAWTGSTVSVDISGTANDWSFLQFNDSSGKSMDWLGNGPAQSWSLVSAGNTLNVTGFSGTTDSFGFTASRSGTVYVGFKTTGGVGWFGISLGGPGGEIRYLSGGQFADAGETLTVGTTIPEGSTVGVGLSLLALGAAGLRRRRAASN